MLFLWRYNLNNTFFFVLFRPAKLTDDKEKWPVDDFLCVFSSEYYEAAKYAEESFPKPFP